MVRKRKTNKAFTLVELMVVIAFITIMSGIVLTSFTNSKDKKIVETEARKVAAVIREAQNYALTGKNASAGCGNSYNLTFNLPSGGAGKSNSKAYQLRGCVSADYTLQNGAIFFNVAMSSGFSFAAPRGEVAGFSGNSMLITIRKNSAYSYMCVYKSGNIIENVTSAICP